MMSEVTAAKVQTARAETNTPVLLCEFEPRHRVFLRNLGDILLQREPSPVETTATPVPVHQDYFIRTGVAPLRFAESYGLHIALIVAIYLVCTLPFFNREPKLHS